MNHEGISSFEGENIWFHSSQVSFHTWFRAIFGGQIWDLDILFWFGSSHKNKKSWSRVARTCLLAELPIVWIIIGSNNIYNIELNWPYAIHIPVIVHIAQRTKAKLGKATILHFRFLCGHLLVPLKDDIESPNDSLIECILA